MTSMTVSRTVGIVLAATFVAANGQSANPFRLGFSRSLFTDVNDTDAKAAIKAWAQTVATERDINMDPSAHLFDRLPDMVSAMKQGKVDAMSVVLQEYAALAREVELGPWFVTKTSGALHEEYVLLAHRDSGISGLEALRGKRLSLHYAARTCLASDWLDFLLSENGYAPSTDGFFGETRRVPKVSTAVLPVFFRKSDACLVAKSSFETLCELNPQLGRKLHALCTSPRLVPAVMCFRKGFESREKDRLLTALRELHTTPAGEQVLTIFMAQSLEQVDTKPLEKTAAFLTNVEARRAQYRAATGITTPLAEQKSGAAHE
jgi:ABC-type phosphate/phosphonate transport system substrate-binding protein